MYYYLFRSQSPLNLSYFMLLRNFNFYLSGILLAAVFGGDTDKDYQWYIFSFAEMIFHTEFKLWILA